MSKVGEYSRDNTIEALIKHAEGHIHKHAMNVEIFLKNALISICKWSVISGILLVYYSGFQ